LSGAATLVLLTFLLWTVLEDAEHLAFDKKAYRTNVVRANVVKAVASTVNVLR
jgi:hypothetical protein